MADEPQSSDVSIVIPSLEASSASESGFDWLHEEQKALKDRNRQDIEDRKTAREQRRKYAKWVFILVCAWITAIFALLLLQVLGPVWLPKIHPLSDRVLLALITSTTIDLIGTFIIVLRYIFHLGENK